MDFLQERSVVAQNVRDGLAKIELPKATDVFVLEESAIVTISENNKWWKILIGFKPQPEDREDEINVLCDLEEYLQVERGLHISISIADSPPDL